MRLHFPEVQKFWWFFDFYRQSFIQLIFGAIIVFFMFILHLLFKLIAFGLEFFHLIFIEFREATDFIFFSLIQIISFLFMFGIHFS